VEEGGGVSFLIKLPQANTKPKPAPLTTMESGIAINRLV